MKAPNKKENKKQTNKQIKKNPRPNLKKKNIQIFTTSSTYYDTLWLFILQADISVTNGGSCKYLPDEATKILLW